jgi:8-oxoguanine deaminase
MDLLLRRIEHLVTFDDDSRELRDVDLLVRNGRIAAIGEPGGTLRDRDDAGGVEEIDGRGLLVLPGLINAHQHLYQVGLRAIPELERAEIRSWLRGVGFRCLLWSNQGRFTPELVGALARAGLVESLLGGVTTVADQHYFFRAGRTEPFMITGSPATRPRHRPPSA